MIKYCFCFFLCVLTLNGADDNEKDLKKAVITRQPNSSCHPFFYLEYFQLPKNPRITIVYDTSTTQPIFFDSPFKHAKYLHGKGAYPSLKMSPYSKIVENLANYHVYLGDANLINKELDRYMKVTAADLQAVAKKYFTKENRTVLYYLPDSSKN